MRLDYNISVTDAALGTNAPFTPDSTLSLNGTAIPAGTFLSVRVACDELVEPPVRLAAVEPAMPDGWLLVFTDKNARRVGTVKVPETLSKISDIRTIPVLSQDGPVRGHVTFSPEYAEQLVGALAGIRTQLKLGTDAFVLLPFCLVPYMRGNARAIGVAGARSTAPVVLVPAGSVYISRDGDNASISICSAEKHELKDGFKWLRVDNVDKVNGAPCDGSVLIWIGGHHMVFRSGLTSNLRVLVDGGIISFEGVLDG